jgi:cytokinesis protein
MVKDTNNESTLMDYVERVVRKQYPQYEDFTHDISGVLTVAKINIEQLQGDAKKYIDNINNVQASLDSGNLSDPKRFHPEDRVAVVVQRFMKEARRKAEQMGLYLEEMGRVFDDILTFFGDDNRDENARREFFGKLAGFVNEYKVCLFPSFPLLDAGICEFTDNRNRNLTRRTSSSKKRGGATRRTCAGKLSKANLLLHPLRLWQVPTELLRPHPPALWTPSSRSSALRPRRREIPATAAGGRD